MEIVTENPTSLAWIGDAIMSLAVRRHLLAKGIRSADRLQKMQARLCSAKAQAAMLRQLQEADYFTEDEKTILRRGRNANVHTKAKNADIQTYLEATALEALLGYLDLYHHEERLQDLMRRIIELGEQL